jgi:phage shock protein PspC (stress-responsive transcriptional regulator)
MATKTCPWCAEPIPAQALKCRFCGSRVEGGLRDPHEWHRGYPERRIAGVCASLAHNLHVSVTAVRAAFVLLTLVHGFGLVLYAVLWFVLPDAPGGRTGLDRAIEAWRVLFHGETRSHPPSDEGEEDRAGGWSPTRS